MIHAITWIIITGLLVVASIVSTYAIMHSAYESNLKRYQRQWEEGKKKFKDEYEKKFLKLDNENFLLTTENKEQHLTIHNLLEDKFNLKKALDIKTASAKGLEISANQWRDAALKFENDISEKEKEHQEEIEKLTNYYQEKLEEEKKHSMDIAEELRQARAFGNYPYESEITMEVSDNNEQLSET